MYFVYILKSKKDKKLYIGFAPDLNARLKKHNNGDVTSTRYRRPLELIYFEGYKLKQDALKRERNLKLYSKAYYALKRRIPYSLS